MSANLFDVGDFQRLDREATLTEQSPRMLPEDDRSPIEEPIVNPFDLMLDGLLEALQARRLQ